MKTKILLFLSAMFLLAGHLSAQDAKDEGDAQRQKRLREVIERDSERPFHVCGDLIGDARGKRQFGGHGTEEMGNLLRTSRLSLSQADARPQLQANLLGQ